MSQPLRILHSADWHLGRQLYGKQRTEEFIAFLQWLLETIEDQHIDLLLMAGDIFDSTTPSHQAQEMYYEFLSALSESHCQHAVFISGNHDSPSLIDAPEKLLKSMNIHVIGTVTDDLNREVIPIVNPSGSLQAIVCAVPYLRDSFVRQSKQAESLDEKHEDLISGITQHYKKTAEIAVQHLSEYTSHAYRKTPIIGMGHLFTAGGRTTHDDGVRELYVGQAAHLSADRFPPCFDYMALGHLHVPQQVGSHEHILYSGSPIPMGFGEAAQEKSVIQLLWEQETFTTNRIPIPRFQELESITGDQEQIQDRLRELASKKASIWLEIEFTGLDLLPDLKQWIESQCKDTLLEPLRIKNRTLLSQMLTQEENNEQLDELSAVEVFQRCLAMNKIPQEMQITLAPLYQSVLRNLEEYDSNAS